MTEPRTTQNSITQPQHEKTLSGKGPFIYSFSVVLDREFLNPMAQTSLDHRTQPFWFRPWKWWGKITKKEMVFLCFLTSCSVEGSPSSVCAGFL